MGFLPNGMYGNVPYWPRVLPAAAPLEASVARMMDTPVVQFYTKAFFEELARHLNEDADWAKWGKALNARILCSAIDLKRSFLIDIKKGRVATKEATIETPANYKFEGRYEAWMALCKGEAELQKLIVAGKIRFTGSMPDLMGLAGPLNRIVMVARSFPKTF
jgi:putative sterol carrier protein